jgi:hypothetical protein
LLFVFLLISPNGEVPFSLVGFPRKAMPFVLKIELGAVTGMVVPPIADPPEIQIWLIGGHEGLRPGPISKNRTNTRASPAAGMG